MKRLLLIAPDLQALGPFGQVATLARQLSMTELVVSTIQLYGDVTFAPDGLARSTTVNWPRRHFNLSALRRLSRLIRDFDADIVHLWSAWTPGWLPWLIKATKDRRPTRWFLTETKTQRPQLMHNDLLSWWLAREGVRWVLSDALIESELVEGAWHPLAIDLVRKGIAIDPSQQPRDRHSWRQRLGLPDHAKLAVTCSPLEPRALLKDIIWATDLIHCVRDDVYLIIVGEGPQAWRLNRFVDQIELRSQVRFVRPENDLESLIASADFYWQASDLFPQPDALLAAMARGVPVIATDTRSNRKFIEHQKTGFLVERGGRNELARCAMRILENPNIARPIGDAASHLAREYWAPDRMSSKMQDLYLNRATDALPAAAGEGLR